MIDILTLNGPAPKIRPSLSSFMIVVPLSVTLKLAFNEMTFSSINIGELSETAPRIYLTSEQYSSEELAAIIVSEEFSKNAVSVPDSTDSESSDTQFASKLLACIGIDLAGPVVSADASSPVLTDVE